MKDMALDMVIIKIKNLIFICDVLIDNSDNKNEIPAFAGNC
jgi:hypothetical protein